MARKTNKIIETTETSDDQTEIGRTSFRMFLKKYSIMITILTIFYTVAITLWLVLDNIFYLINFMIIGTSIGLGLGLWPVLQKSKKHIARKVSQVLVGSYMFFGLGFGVIYLIWGYLEPENMQLEGFWFWLISGTFAAGVIHYSIAKIFGPTLFGRGWCGWSCWTAAVLDLLPWKKSPGRKKMWGYLRYVHLALSTILVFVLVFVFNYTLSTTRGVIDFTGYYTSQGGTHLKSSLFQIHEFWWFLIGNLIYFTLAISLAAILKDNRAFCKYVCPIAPVMKICSRASIMKISVDKETCIQCRACERACPMDIKILDYSTRVTSTECIQCLECVNACPTTAIKATFRFDIGFKEYLRVQEAS